MHPERHRIELGRAYPRAWRAFDEIRTARSSTWPAWCWLPVCEAESVVARQAGLSSLQADSMRSLQTGLFRDVASLAAVAAWRSTQGIYRFHPALQEELAHSTTSGEIPLEVLQALPEWCVYVDLDGASGPPMRGFFAHLDVDSRGEYLRFLLDFDDYLLPLPVHLVAGGLVAGVESTLAHISKRLDEMARPQRESVYADLDPKLLMPCLSMVLYLCSRNLDLVAANAPAARMGEPHRVPPTKARHGLRTFPPDYPRQWDVGSRIGPQLELAQSRAAAAAAGGSHAGPRPHVRRAHWHTYLLGQGRVRPELRWIHPILVGGADVVPSVRRINA